MAFPNRFQDDSSLLRVALKRGIIDTSICHQCIPARISVSMSRSKVPVATIQNIDQNTQALRTQVHTFDRTEALDPTLNHIVELARITVPEGNVGHVESIEQYLADSAGRFYATSSEYWGMPYNETVPITDIVWFLRLDNYDGTLADRYAVNALVMANPRGLLPGQAWPDLPEFNGIWFPANHRKGFSGTVPSGKQLRFFAWVPPSASEVYTWRISGRLVARVQSELCSEALKNTRLLQ